MKKLSIIALVIGTAAATAYFVSKLIQKKKSDDAFFDEYDCDCDCDECTGDCESCMTNESDLDVEIPDEDYVAEDIAEEAADEDDADADVEEEAKK